MRTLDFEKMENLQGGKSDYCVIMEYWVTHGYDGYQGDRQWCYDLWYKYCSSPCPY